jgi:hypothetical protein
MGEFDSLEESSLNRHARLVAATDTGKTNTKDMGCI